MLLSLLVLPFALVASARPMVQERDLTLSSLVSAVVCPKGQTLFQVTNEVTVPKASPAKVWAYLGNFCDVSWQGFELISTTGACNTPTSTRTFSGVGLTLTEQLDFNLGSSSNPAAWQDVFAQSFTLLGQPASSGAVVSKVHDLLVVKSSKGGSDIKWDVVGCSNVTAIGQAIFSQVHGGALAGTVAHFA